MADGLLRPRGYFSLDEVDGRAWLIDPDGGRFLSKGVNTVRADQDRIRNTDRVPYAEACLRKYGSVDAWRAAAARRLLQWGFNTLGAWSDETVAGAGPSPIACAPNLDLGMSFAWAANDAGKPEQHFPDVFDPAFVPHLRRRARELCGHRQGDPGIVGWFIDNELRWGPDWRGSDELLLLFLNAARTHPGRDAAIRWLRERHPAFASFNTAWRTPAASWDEFATLEHVSAPCRRKPPYQRKPAEELAADGADPGRAAFFADCDGFAARVAERYFALTTAAIKTEDPNHLVLGCRFAYVLPRAIVEAAARACDVVSFNCYDPDPGAALAVFTGAGKPCLIGEFSFRAADSGLPNSNGAGPLVATQAERAARFRHYVTTALQHRALVGYHWFEHADQPAEGRFDGENSNFGTVTIDDRVYEALTQAMTAVNAEAESLHAAYATA